MEIRENRGSSGSAWVSDDTVVRKCIATRPLVPGRAIDGRLARTILRARRGTSSLLASRSFCWPPIILFLHTTRQRVHCPRRGDRSGATVDGTALRRHFVDAALGSAHRSTAAPGQLRYRPVPRGWALLAVRGLVPEHPCGTLLDPSARSTAPAYPPCRSFVCRSRSGAGSDCSRRNPWCGPLDRNPSGRRGSG